MSLTVTPANHATYVDRLRDSLSINPGATPATVKTELDVVSSASAESILGLTNQGYLWTIKEAVKGMDMTAISGTELANLGELLQQKGIIDADVAGTFTSVSSSATADTERQSPDARFNAIELFDKHYSEARSRAETSQQTADSWLKANHVLNALSYFARSGSGIAGIDETV